jgi:hypothetical protein
VQLFAKHPHRSLLHLAQGSHQGEQGGFAAPGWAREQHHLTGSDGEIHRLQHLPLHGAGAIPVAQPGDLHHHVRRSRPTLQTIQTHQKISAGSASASRRIARAAEPMHITRIMVNTVKARVVFIVTGSWVALRTNQ